MKLSTGFTCCCNPSPLPLLFTTSRHSAGVQHNSGPSRTRRYILSSRDALYALWEKHECFTSERGGRSRFYHSGKSNEFSGYMWSINWRGENAEGGLDGARKKINGRAASRWFLRDYLAHGIRISSRGGLSPGHLKFSVFGGKKKKKIPGNDESSRKIHKTLGRVSSKHREK